MWKNQKYVASSVAVRTTEGARHGRCSEYGNMGVANDNERMLGKENVAKKKN
jgi:hypothetical protein